MKNFKILLINFIFIVGKTVLFSQTAPTIEWQKSFGGSDYENAYSIKQTSDGGFIVSGSTESNDGDVSNNHGGMDCWVLKLDGLGSLMWQKTFGGSSDEKAYDIIETTDGGYIFIGRTFSNDNDVNGNHGNEDFWLVKLDNSGSISWQKTLGGSEGDYSASINQTDDNGFIVLGSSGSNDGDVNDHIGSLDYWLVKLDILGNISWGKSYGSAGVDGAECLQQTSDGGFIISGTTFGNDGDVSGNHGWYDGWIAKLNNMGDITWKKCLGGSDYDFIKSVQQTADGGYIVGAYTNSTDGDVNGNHGSNEDYLVIKLDDHGNIVWQKCYGGSSFERLTSIRQTSEGGYIISGESNSNNDGDVSGNLGNGYDFWIVKINELGEMEWQKSLGGSNSWETAYSIEQTGDGGFIVAGSSASQDGDVTGNHGLSDFWLVKLESTSAQISNKSSLNNVNLFPNPISDTVTITGPKIELVELFDGVGKLILSTNEAKMNLSILHSGIYYVSVNKSTQIKIIKE
jgi:hypothetical protein